MVTIWVKSNHAPGRENNLIIPLERGRGPLVASSGTPCPLSDLPYNPVKINPLFPHPLRYILPANFQI
jgi:hypothetical protein